MRRVRPLTRRKCNRSVPRTAFISSFPDLIRIPLAPMNKAQRSTRSRSFLPHRGRAKFDQTTRYKNGLDSGSDCPNNKYPAVRPPSNFAETSLYRALI